jgi:4-amino-4-deoxy-L-arabinose transferase-like glycosyltransferase
MFPLTVNSYTLNLDSIVGLFGLLSLYSWWKTSQLNKNQALPWFIIWGVAIGLGVMTKSIVGLFPLVPIAIFAVLNRDFKFLKNRHFWFGVLISLLISLPWHIYQSIRVGQSFWENYFFYHVIQRYSTSLETNGAPFLYYFKNVFVIYPLSSVVFGFGLIASFFSAIKDRDTRYILVGAVTLFLTFSSSITKGPAYIVMALPLIVILSGVAAEKLFKFIPKDWMKVFVVIVLLFSFG